MKNNKLKFMSFKLLDRFRDALWACQCENLGEHEDGRNETYQKLNI